MVAQCDADLTACEEAVARHRPTRNVLPVSVVTRHAATPRSSSAGPGLRWVNALPMGNGYQMYEQAYGQPVTRDTMLVPFVASAFTGVFQGQTPAFFEPIPPEHRCTSDASCDSTEHSGVCCLPNITDPQAERASCSDDEDCSGGRECQEGE